MPGLPLLDRRLRELVAGPERPIHPALSPLHKALSVTEPPGTALRWLTRTIVSTFLADVADGRRQLSHKELDRLERSPTLDHLRSVLVSTGTLPARDEHMARLERAIDDLLDSRDDPAERQLLYRYAVWHLVRRLRRRTSGQAITSGQFRACASTGTCCDRAGLDRLSAEHLTLVTCHQGDLERWLSR